MISENRYKKLRKLLKRTNRERKKQGKQIDILCNDLISAQRDFVSHLKDIAFTASFYESIMGACDYNGLFYVAGKLIARQVPEANISFVLRESRSGYTSEPGFRLFVAEGSQKTQKDYLRDCLNSELVENICRSKQLCDMQGMLEMGLTGNPSKLKGISAAAIPLGGYNICPGFLLLSKSGNKKLKSGEVDRVCGIIPGLSRAANSCVDKAKSGKGKFSK
jgi:hypothetical protein